VGSGQKEKKGVDSKAAETRNLIHNQIDEFVEEK